MLRARLTSKGRVTIPVEIRLRYQLRLGDEVGFRAEGSSIRLSPLKKRKPTDLSGSLPSATRRHVDRVAERNEIGRALGAQLQRKLPHP